MNRQRGVALIIVLWVVTVMGTFTMLYSRQARLALKVNKNLNDGVQAELLAEAGVQRMIGELVNDDTTTTYDSLDETWSDSADLFYDAQLGNGVYRVTRPDLSQPGAVAYGAVDECSKLNVNTATRQQLMALPNATDEIVDAILDWRDDDDDPRTYGAEFDYYMSLEEPYQPKNGQFDTLNELLLVKGMSVDVLYGEDVNANGILDANENDGEASYPIDNADGELDKGWIHYLTVFSYEKNVTGDGSSRVNINEADEETMKDQLGDVLEDQDIQNIISGRNNNQYQRIGDLISPSNNNNNGGGGRNGGGSGSNGVLDRDKMRDVADLITVSSDQQLFGRININTAPREVLTCLLPNNEELVEAILERRESGDGPFENIGQLLDVQGITNGQFANLTETCCAKSAVFSMRAAGYIETSKAYKEIYAIVDRGADPVTLRYWKNVR
ncbi:MAG: hypothetical protein GC154_20660 [bacterium]|nr:hypothetical protein [bacterium]